MIDARIRHHSRDRNSGPHHVPLRLAVFRAAVKILTSWRVSSSRAMNSFLDRANPVAR
jgi:hypothetical protein